VAYRFLIAGCILLSYCAVRKIKLRFSMRQHFAFIMLALSAFSINYFGTYYSEIYLPSGIVAVLFATIPFWNILNAHLFLDQKPQPAVVFGAMVGICGVVILFYKDIFAIAPSLSTLKGLAFGGFGALVASLGNIVSAHNTRRGIGIVQANAFGMFYGGFISLTIGLFTDGKLSFQLNGPYVLSLLYLSIFGSIVAFGAYFSLIKLMGPAKASYSSVVIPVVALVLSTIFEKFEWTAPAIAGVLVILGGNIAVMWKKRIPRPQPIAGEAK